MHSVLAVFANDRMWQRLPAEERDAVSAALAEKARESLQWALDADRSLVDELRRRGMTVITEAEGLDIAAFRAPVLAQVQRDFPAWAPYIERIAAIPAQS
jgi:TRAP-type C4-dicarboxylate transport system substrate-binding protein